MAFRPAAGDASQPVLTSTATSARVGSIKADAAPQVDARISEGGDHLVNAVTRERPVALIQ